MLPLKLSRNEQCAVMFVLWAKTLDANQFHTEMHPVRQQMFYNAISTRLM